MTGSGGTSGRSVRLVVIGDSFAFTDHEGPQLPDVPHLFPNVVAAELRAGLGQPVDLAVIARAGWLSARAAHRPCPEPAVAVG